MRLGELHPGPIDLETGASLQGHRADAACLRRAADILEAGAIRQTFELRVILRFLRRIAERLDRLP